MAILNLAFTSLNGFLNFVLKAHNGLFPVMEYHAIGQCTKPNHSKILQQVFEARMSTFVNVGSNTILTTWYTFQVVGESLLAAEEMLRDPKKSTDKEVNKLLEARHKTMEKRKEFEAFITYLKTTVPYQWNVQNGSVLLSDDVKDNKIIGTMDVDMQKILGVTELPHEGVKITANTDQAPVLEVPAKAEDANKA